MSGPARTPSWCSTVPARDGQKPIAPLGMDRPLGRWHSAASLAVPANITLLPLPPYSPELNPVENVWQYLRQNQLSLRVWDDYAAIVDTCCQAWNALVAMPDRLASITRREWAKAVRS